MKLAVGLLLLRGGADKPLARPGRKKLYYEEKEENRHRQTDTSLLLDYEKTFHKGRKTMSFMHFTT